MGENMLHALRPKFIDGSHLRSIQEQWLPQTLPDVTSPSLMDSRPSVATEIQIDQLALVSVTLLFIQHLCYPHQARKTLLRRRV